MDRLWKQLGGTGPADDAAMPATNPPPQKHTRPHMRIIVDSDLHFTESGIRSDKAAHAAVIRDLASKYNINAIICAGDLTDMGWDGKRFLCWQYGGAEDQVSPLRRWVEGLEADAAPVYLATGNHDQYVPWPYRHKGVRDYVESKHGKLHYNWDYVTDGNIRYRAVCLDVYPDATGRKYLAGVFAQYPDDRYIIYFHYNLDGQYSDWWTEAEKTKFADMLAGRDIALIICGHWHINAHVKWRGYDVAMGAGSQVAMFTIYDSGVIMSEH